MKRESKQKMGRIPPRMTAVILHLIRKRMMVVTFLISQSMKRLKSSKKRKTRSRNRRTLMRKKSWLL